MGGCNPVLCGASGLMPHACIRLRPGSGYGRDFFSAGLLRLGYTTTDRPSRSPSASDVLLLWNRRRCDEPFAAQYERAGASVIIAENGYLGSDDNGRKLYAMAIGHHNGAGSWPVGDDATRWHRQNIILSPWRQDGAAVVALPQRGIGERGVAMPTGWLVATTKRLASVTRRPVRIRRHPGLLSNAQGPEAALVGAWVAVTWGSSAALKAMVAGIPVFHDLPTWIGAPAAGGFGGADIEHPILGDREAMLHRLSYAQWSRAEIQRGEAFAWLLT